MHTLQLTQRTLMSAVQSAVLIVEDDSVIRESLCEMLVEEGYQVATACHGREALDMLRGGSRPCIVVLDLMMPVMDGWQLLDIMRNDQGLQQIPILVVSASRESTQPEGAVRFLNKPINLDALLTEVGSRCCRRADRGSAAALP
jgi:CheY-like chemotaxis protein